MKRNTLKPRCGGLWTEAQYITFVKNQLRGATWKWAVTSKIKTKSRVSRGIYKCNLCSNLIPNKLTIVDHIRPVMSPFSIGKIDWNEVINNLFCEEDNLQVICEECHTLKTKQEKDLRKEYMNYSKTYPNEYNSWRSMYRRCFEPGNNKYDLYGGLGISVEDSWNPYKSKGAFINFLKDMGPRPEGCTLERKNNNLNYTKDNCIWADYFQQNNNRPSYNHNIEFNGKIQSLSNWAKEYGLKYTTVDERLKRGWSIEDALTKPIRKNKKNELI